MDPAVAGSTFRIHGVRDARPRWVIVALIPKKPMEFPCWMPI